MFAPFEAPYAGTARTLRQDTHSLLNATQPVVAAVFDSGWSFRLRLQFACCIAACWLAVSVARADDSSGESAPVLRWHELARLPDELGVAGPFAGVHHDALIIAGGANFPKPVWENDKVWHDEIYVLSRTGGEYAWSIGGRLPRPLAYGSAVSTADGVVCMGGNDSDETFSDVFLLANEPDTDRVTLTEYPSLPKPCAFGSATLVGDVIYLAGGQSGQTLDTAMTNFWSLDLSKRHDPAAFRWQPLEPFPGPSRALNITVSQHDDASGRSVYVISGRRQEGDEVEFLKDCWQFAPDTGRWRRRADSPRSMMAGVGMDHGRSYVLVLGGADGSLFHRADELRDAHPGFPKEAFAYHTSTDTWESAGSIPQNHVTTIAVKWNDAIIIPSGEIRPRVRSPTIWHVTAEQSSRVVGDRQR